MKLRASYGILAIVLASGCSGAQYHMPKVELPTDRYEVLGESEGTAVGVHLFQLFPIKLNDKFGRAVDQAVAKRGGDALVDVTVQEGWFWAYILNGYRTTVRGTVVRRR